MSEANDRAHDVALLLGEKEYFLVPTLRAHKAVNHRFGGFAGAYQRLQVYDFDAFVAIIAAGLNKRDPEDIEKIEHEVYENGLQPLNKPLTLFVDALINGGRKPKTEDEDEKADPAKKD